MQTCRDTCCDGGCSAKWTTHNPIGQHSEQGTRTVMNHGQHPLLVNENKIDLLCCNIGTLNPANMSIHRTQTTSATPKRGGDPTPFNYWPTQKTKVYLAPLNLPFWPLSTHLLLFQTHCMLLWCFIKNVAIMYDMIVFRLWGSDGHCIWSQCPYLRAQHNYLLHCYYLFSCLSHPSAWDPLDISGLYRLDPNNV
jgi:hypothetical protein